MHMTWHSYLVYNVEKMEPNEERKTNLLRVTAGSLTFSRYDKVGLHDGSTKPKVDDGV